MVDAYLTGIFPRSEELIAATRALDRRRVEKAEVDKALRGDLESLVSLQVQSGLTFLSSGYLNWQDIFRPLVEAWDGITLGGLTRWYDNNNFYRQPVISEEPRPQPLSEHYLPNGHLPTTHPRVVSLPGPYTFYDLSEDRYFLKPERAIAGLADCLAVVAQSLRVKGVDLVQFLEPSLVVHPPDSDVLEAIKQAYEKVATMEGLQSSVQLYFASAIPVLSDLLNLKVDYLSLDLYEEELDELPDLDFQMGLAYGCLDARNSLMETPEEVAVLVRKVDELLSPPRLALTTNSSLELLPRTVAEEKLRVLGRVREILEETS